MTVLILFSLVMMVVAFLIVSTSVDQALDVRASDNEWLKLEKAIDEARGDFRG